MSITKAVRTDAPVDRLTKFCDALASKAEDLAEYRDGDRCIVVAINKDGHGGIGCFGEHYQDDDEHIVRDLFKTVEAVLATQGKRMEIVPIVVGSPTERD